jgi:molybdopterin converting factor small subunit
MNVKINIPTYMKDKTDGVTQAQVTGHNVEECIEALISQYPGLKGEILDDRGTILLRWMIYINNKSVNSSDELSHPLNEGDVIEFLPVVAGG